MRKLCFLLFLLILPAGSGLATEGPSVDLGKRLFASPALGSNGKSCTSCHPGGKGLEGSGAYDDNRLKEVINACIRQALQGRPLAIESQELDSMLLYLRAMAGR